MVGFMDCMAFVQKTACSLYILYVQLLESYVILLFYDLMEMGYGETCLVFCSITNSVSCLMVITWALPVESNEIPFQVLNGNP